LGRSWGGRGGRGVRRIALGLRHSSQRLYARVKAREVAAFRGEQRLELRHFLSVEPDRSQARIVRPLRKPVVVRAEAIPFALKRRVFRTHGVEGSGLGCELVRIAAAARVERNELGPRVVDEPAEAVAITPARGELQVETGIVLRCEPAAKTLLLDGDCERFVEHR